MSRHHTDTDLDPTVAAELNALEAALTGDPAAPPELAALVASVREDAPGPNMSFREELDTRVADGFPAAGGGARTWPAAVRARLPRISLTPGPALGLAAAVVIALVVSVGVLGQAGTETASTTETLRPISGGPGASGAASATDAQPSEPSAVGRTEGAYGPAPGTVAPAPGSPTPTPKSGRKVQRTTRLSLTTSAGRLQDVADDVVHLTQSAGGVVQSSNVDATDRGGSAAFELSVPTAEADETIKRLSALAHVDSLSQATIDITASYVAAADLLSDTRAELRTSLKALKGAKTDAGIARLRKRIRDRRREIASLEGQVKRVRARADNTTVSVSLTGRGSSKADDGSAGGGPWSPGDAAGDALRVLEVAAGVLLIALAVAVPLGLILLPALFGARVTRRRRREHALDAV